METTSSMSPERLILTNEAALSALQRSQLVNLCKRWEQRANGKNIEMVARLLEVGRLQSSMASQIGQESEDGIEEEEGGVQDRTNEGDWSMLEADSSTVLPDPVVATVSDVSFNVSDASADMSLEQDSGIRLVNPSPVTSPERNYLVPIPHGTTSIATLKGDDSPPVTPSAASPFIFGASASAPFAFSLPSATQSAAEVVMMEMQKRVEEARAKGLGASATMSSGELDRSQDSKGKGKGTFEGRHKREFDQMDSITSHYAAKRDPTRSTSYNNLKSLATSSSKPTPTPTFSRSLSSKSLSQSTSRPAKKLKSSSMVRALKDEGWAETTAPVSAKVALGASASSSRAPRSGESGSMAREEMRNPWVGSSGVQFAKEVTKAVEEKGEDKEREERKRKMELAKARRRSNVAGAGTARRRSTQVGRAPIPPPSNAASRFLKSTFKKFGSSTATAKPAPSAAPAAVISEPAIPARVPRQVEKPAAESKSKKPGWAKFDLQASLARPLSYTPRLAPPKPKVASILGSKPTALPPSTLKRTSSLSSTTAPLKRSSSSLSTSMAPPAHLRRAPSLSARVANNSMLDAVKASDENRPVPKEVDEEMEVVQEKQEDEGTANTDFLTAPAEALPSFPFSPATASVLAHPTPNPPSSPFRPILASPGPSALATSRAMNVTSPSRPSQIGKNKIAAGSKKVVSSATRSARDGGQIKARNDLALKTNVRRVVAKKAVAQK